MHEPTRKSWFGDDVEDSIRKEMPVPGKEYQCLDCGCSTKDYYVTPRKHERGRYYTVHCVECHELEVRRCGKDIGEDETGSSLTFEWR